MVLDNTHSKGRYWGVEAERLAMVWVAVEGLQGERVAIVIALIE